MVVDVFSEVIARVLVDSLEKGVVAFHHNVNDSPQTVATSTCLQGIN